MGWVRSNMETKQLLGGRERYRMIRTLTEDTYDYNNL
jgi:hypothetical protein